MKRHIGLFVVALVAVVLHRAAAQPPDRQPVTKTAPAVETAPAQETAKSWHVFPVRNVRAGLLAWWLDAKHNPEPLEVKASRQSWAEMRPASASPGPDNNPQISVPDVSTVIGMDARNEIHAFCTEDGAQKLENVLGFLDQPLKQAEVSLYDVEMDTAAFKALGGSRGDDSLIYFLPGTATRNFPAELDALVAAGKAEILNAPRVTALNNLAAGSGKTTLTPQSVHVGEGTVEFRTHLGSKAAPVKAAAYLAQHSGFVVTPTINNDGSITLFLRTGTTLSLKGASDTEASIPLQSDDAVESVVNVRDGETVAIAGLKTRLREKGSTSTNAERIRVYFVTARVVKRAE